MPNLPYTVQITNYLCPFNRNIIPIEIQKESIPLEGHTINIFYGGCISIYPVKSVEHIKDNTYSITVDRDYEL